MHYYITTDRLDMVTVQFEKFNANFKQLEVVFQEVTGKPFKPGQKVSAAGKNDGQVKKYIIANILKTCKHMKDHLPQQFGVPLSAEEEAENLDISTGKPFKPGQKLSSAEKNDGQVKKDIISNTTPRLNQCL